ncbi:hypothetical protein [Clostridium sp. DL1XJH146]
MGLDMKEIYRGRIEQIDIDSKKCIHYKDWKQLAKLKAEKKRLEDLIEKMR